MKLYAIAQSGSPPNVLHLPSNDKKTESIIAKSNEGLKTILQFRQSINVRTK